MTSRRVTAAACRACGLDARVGYVTVLGRCVPLCRQCMADFVGAEARCGARGIERERAANAAAAKRNGHGK